MNEKTVPTKQARIPGDLAEKLGVIAWHESTTVVDLIDDMIRESVQEKFDTLPEVVKQRALDRIAELTS